MEEQDFTKVLTDAELLATIQRNLDAQKRHPFDSLESTVAREANRFLFQEANRRGLEGVVS